MDQIADGKCDCRTVILAIMFYRSLVSESSVTGLGVYTRRWVSDNITPDALCYLARVRPVISTVILIELCTDPKHLYCLLKSTLFTVYDGKIFRIHFEALTVHKL